jgi:FkbM family methyltransferase
MLHKLYRTALRLPDFRGKSRLAAAMRRQFAPPITDVRGFRMQLDPMDWLQIDILTNGGIEPKTAALFHRILRSGDTYIDVGAHVGYHALVARQIVGPAGYVLAVEPQPYNTNKILVNAALNGFSNITTVVGAVGESDGIVVLHDQVATDKSRLTLCGGGVNDGIATFEVPLWSLDTLIKRFDLARIRLLKIDVEGYELNVFKGAVGSLPNIENMIFEVLPDLPAEAASEIRALLSSRGFSLSSVEGAPWQEGHILPEGNVWARRAQMSN